MSLFRTVSDNDLSVAGLLSIDEVCDRFESAWRAGSQPALEAFVEGIEGDVRARLLRELLILEVEFRRDAGERPELEAYLARFPDDERVVESVFLELASGLETLVGASRAPLHGIELAPEGREALRAEGYEILGELGRGGMGVVYLANKVALNRRCALKMILAGAHAGTAASARFRGEAEAIARLRHPAIVQIYHIGEAGGLPYLELEYLPGGSLDRRLDGTPWPADVAARLVEVLAHAIGEAHRQGIVHRDLKPANILLDADNRPKVGDFGLAKMLDTDDGITRTQMVLGSPSYMAPEQAEGRSKAVGPATDVYALGAIFYELLTGHPPFRAPTPIETLNLVRMAEPVSPSRYQPGLPRAAETICLKCLEKPPARRYATADELAEDLRRFGAGESILAHPTPPWEQAWRWTWRRPAVAAAVGVSAVALLLLLGGGLYYNARLRAAVLKARAAEQSAIIQRNLALKAYNQLVYDLQERLGDSAATRPTRRALLKTAIQGLDEIARGNEGTPPDLSRAVAHVKMGDLYAQIGLGDEAGRQYEQAKQLAEAAPLDLAAAECLRGAFAGLGALKIARGRPAEARADLRRVVVLSEQIVQADPNRAEARRALIEAYLQLGRAFAFNNERKAAEAHFLRMHDLAARWVADEPHNAEARDLLSSSHRKLADERKIVHDYEGARPHYVKAIALAREVVDDQPTNDRFKLHLAIAVDDLAGVVATQRRFDEARSLFREAEQLCTSQVQADPESLDAQLRLILTQSKFGRMEKDDAQFARAAELFQSALDRLNALEREGRLASRPDDGAPRIKTLQTEIAECKAAMVARGLVRPRRSAASDQ